MQVCCNCSKNGFHVEFKDSVDFGEHVKVFDLAAKGKTACAIALSVGVGKMQIQGILAKKTLILQSWKAGTKGKMQYLAAKQSKNGDLIQHRPKPASAGVLGQLGGILLDCVLFLLFLFL